MPILDRLFTRPTIARPTSATYRGWSVVFLIGTVLAVLAMIDRGGVEDLTGSEGSADCRLEVTVDELNVRAGSDVATELVQTLQRGDVVDGTRDVVDGFRRLEGDRWASDAFLEPVPDTTCG